MTAVSWSTSVRFVHRTCSPGAIGRDIVSVGWAWQTNARDCVRPVQDPRYDGPIARESKSLLTPTQIPLLSQNTNDILPFTQSRTSFPRSINSDILEEMMVFVYGNPFQALEVEPQYEDLLAKKEQGEGWIYQWTRNAKPCQDRHARLALDSPRVRIRTPSKCQPLYTLSLYRRGSRLVFARVLEPTRLLQMKVLPFDADTNERRRDGVPIFIIRCTRWLSITNCTPRHA